MDVPTIYGLTLGMSMSPKNRRLRRTVLLVALLNLAYFGVEFAVAAAIASVSLFADSVDFLEDAAINLLIFTALGWSARKRALIGMLLAGILLVPGAATLWTAWEKFNLPLAPEPVPLTLAAFGALLVNLTCALMLARVRQNKDSLSRAAFLSARNDVLADIAIILAGVVTAATVSHWPDLIVGLGIFVINLDAAREVLEAAREEHRQVIRPQSDVGHERPFRLDWAFDLIMADDRHTGALAGATYAL